MGPARVEVMIIYNGTTYFCGRYNSWGDGYLQGNHLLLWGLLEWKWWSFIVEPLASVGATRAEVMVIYKGTTYFCGPCKSGGDDHLQGNHLLLWALSELRWWSLTREPHLLLWALPELRSDGHLQMEPSSSVDPAWAVVNYKIICKFKCLNVW